MDENQKDENQKEISFFVEDTEELITSIGGNYLLNYLSGGGLSRAFAVVSNKRFYFKGKCFINHENGKWKQVVTEKTVDLKDITGTGFMVTKYISFLITSILNFIALLVQWFYLKNYIGYDSMTRAEKGDAEARYLLFILLSIIFLFLYYIRKRRLFIIEFAGGVGNISFLINGYNREYIEEFQKELRKAKEELEKVNNEIEKFEQPVIQNERTNSIAEELLKYSDLYKQGLLTEDEYNQLKKGLINKR